jgi:hypothetical protein
MRLIGQRVAVGAGIGGLTADDEVAVSSANSAPRRTFDSEQGKLMPEAMIGRPIEILLVEDSPADALMTPEAFNHSILLNKMHAVDNGVDALGRGR